MSESESPYIDYKDPMFYLAVIIFIGSAVGIGFMFKGFLKSLGEDYVEVTKQGPQGGGISGTGGQDEIKKQNQVGGQDDSAAMDSTKAVVKVEKILDITPDLYPNYSEKCKKIDENGKNVVNDCFCTDEEMPEGVDKKDPYFPNVECALCCTSNKKYHTYNIWKKVGDATQDFCPKVISGVFPGQLTKTPDNEQSIFYRWCSTEKGKCNLQPVLASSANIVQQYKNRFEEKDGKCNSS